MKSLLLLFLAFCVPTIACAAQPGALVIVGGGGTPDEVVAEAVRLAGGAKANVVILPQASSRKDRGTSSVEMFERQKVADVKVVEFDHVAAAKSAITSADLIWFPGGQQSRLMEALVAAGLDSLIAKRYSDGAVIGGTSAGAAIMSPNMIVRSPDMPGLRSGNTPTAQGLGLARDLLIDQHFVERQRMNRLLTAVLDQPRRIGVGIGERTAIVVQGQHFKVLGEGSVIVIDARYADVETADSGLLKSDGKISLRVLVNGDEFGWLI